jgi:hypothetical protein
LIYLSTELFLLLTDAGHFLGTMMAQDLTQNMGFSNVYGRFDGSLKPLSVGDVRK